MNTKDELLAKFKEYGRRQHEAEPSTKQTPLTKPQLLAQVDRALEVEKKLKPDNATLLLDDPVGTGKTLVALAAAGLLLRDHKVKAILVVAPNANVADAWAKRAEWLDLVTDRNKARVRAGQSLWKAGTIRVATQRELKQKSKVVFSNGDSLVIVDEAHRGLQHDETEAFQLLSKAACGQRLLLVSATPFQIRGDGLACMLGVNRTVIERSQLTRLLTDYSAALIHWLKTLRDVGGVEDGKSVRDALIRLERIEEAVGPKLKAHRLTRYRRKVMNTPEPKLPEPVTIEPGQWGLAYHVARVALELAGDDGKGKDDTTHRMLLSSGRAFRESGGGKRLTDTLEAAGQQALAAELFTRLGEVPYDHPKVQATVDAALDQFKEGRHVLVFCIFKGTQRDLADELEYWVGPDHVLRPESASALKGHDLARFRTRGASPLVIVARDNLSESIDLDGGHPALIHHDLSWNPARLDQRWGRIVRAGSGFKKPDFQYVPLLDLPAERRLYDTMKNRDRMGERLLPIGTPETPKSE